MNEDYFGLSNLFVQIAEQETGYKARAFHTASAIVLSAKTTDIDKLSTYRGFGNSCMEITEEFNATGTSSRLIRKPITELNNTSIVESEKDKLQEELSRSAKAKHPRDKIVYILSEIKRRFDRIFGGITPRYYVAGSYRRGRSVIGDVDIIMVNAPIEKRHELISIFDTELMAGDLKISGVIQGVQIDIQFVDLENSGDVGAYLLHSTGPASLNIYMRKCAMRRGWKLSQYGLVDQNENVISRDEIDIFKKLNLRPLTPTERENWQQYYK